MSKPAQSVRVIVFTLSVSTLSFGHARSTYASSPTIIVQSCLQMSLLTLRDYLILGGIWTKVNKTAGLQVPSLLYRFHPGVLWSCMFPKRDEIVCGMSLDI